MYGPLRFPLLRRLTECRFSPAFFATGMCFVVCDLDLFLKDKLYME